MGVAVENSVAREGGEELSHTDDMGDVWARLREPIRLLYPEQGAAQCVQEASHQPPHSV